jgi:hypothetical protein
MIQFCRSSFFYTHQFSLYKKLNICLRLKASPSANLKSGIVYALMLPAIANAALHSAGIETRYIIHFQIVIT